MNEAYAPSPQLLRGLQLRQLGRYADAAGAFREALSQNPQDAFALHQLALCQLNLPDQQIKALETVRQAISLEPEEADHFVLQSFIFSSLDKPKEALQSARSSLEIDPHLSGAFAAEAQPHLQLSDWAAAERAARAALALDPDFPMAANQLAHALRLQNKMAENAEQIAGMLARDPEDADTHSSAGWSALQQGQHRDAERHFREALRLEPDHESAREGMLSSFRARSPFYRRYLAYVFWMQRIGGGARWAVIIGLYLVVKVVRTVFQGPYAPIGIAIAAIYFLFVLWVWVANAFGNFILLFDRFARIVLRRDEKIEAVAVGGGMTLGLILLAAALGLGAKPLLLPSIAVLASTFPLSMTFTNRAPIGAWISGGIAGVTLLGGVLCGFSEIIPSMKDGPGMALFGIGIFGCLLCTWLGNLPFFRRAR